ncbi:MAG TPA: choice-of-anchor Q domain-containing protein [Puia sp.]|nr:choice-of-anchor Q domain-containing protein [Puia sp.]
MKIHNPLLLLSFVLIAIPAFSTTYYVSPSGNDNSTGLSESTAFQTLQKGADATQPGDTVLVMNGTYTNSMWASLVMNINKQGTSSQWIVFKNYPGHTPVIQMSGNWCGISISGSAYIIVDGFTVIGNNDNVTLAYAQAQELNPDNPLTSGSGITAQVDFNDHSIHSHHIIIRNCIVKKCGGAGIGSSQADYMTVDHNTVSECAWYSPYDGSAISLYQLWNSDGVVTTKNFVTNNTCYNNRNYIPFFVADTITDGNGIIIDDARNTQNGSTLGAYQSSTYIANNVVFGNGGRGIHVFSSDNVTVINNTSYYNCQSPELPGAELSAIYAGNVSFINNISVPHDALQPMGQYISTNITADHNVWGANAATATPYGTNTLVGDPKFVNASTNGLVADFHLQPGSIAANAGVKTNAPTTDHDGQARTQSDSIDIGAYIVENVILAINTGLTQWSGSAADTYNKLLWQYGPNDKLDSFSVEKSTDGNSFSGLGIIKKNADSSTSYQFVDELPANIINYYRLKIYTAGAAATYSTVISINNKKETTTATAVTQTIIAPNPIRDQFTVTAPFNQNNQNLIEVFNEVGMRVYSNKFTSEKTTINSSPWPVGWYVVIVHGTGAKQQIPILKQ